MIKELRERFVEFQQSYPFVHEDFYTSLAISKGGYVHLLPDGNSQYCSFFNPRAVDSSIVVAVEFARIHDTKPIVYATCLDSRLDVIHDEVLPVALDENDITHALLQCAHHLEHNRDVFEDYSGRMGSKF